MTWWERLGNLLLGVLFSVFGAALLILFVLAAMAVRVRAGLLILLPLLVGPFILGVWLPLLIQATAVITCWKLFTAGKAADA